eukprot:3616312-Rhodomonas_salina.1
MAVAEVAQLTWTVSPDALSSTPPSFPSPSSAILASSVGVVKGGSRARHPQRARFLTESGGESWVVDGRAELQRGAVESGRKGGEERCHCAGAEKHEEHGEHR